MTNPRHVPVLLDRVVALVAPALDHPGSVLVDATLGLGGHAEAVLERCPSARVIGVDRDQHALDLGRRPARGVRRADHACARGVRRDPRGARGPGLRVGRRRAVRPRRLLHAARRARARLRLRRGRPARHADGRHHRADRGRRAQRLLRRDLARLLRTTARRSSPARSRGPSSASGPRSRSPARRRLVELLRDDDPGPGPSYRGAPGQAHVPGAADRGQRRARRAAPGDPGRDRRDRRRRPGRGDELPLARGPDGQAGVRRTHPQRRAAATCRSCPRATSRPCAWSPAGRSRPRPRRSKPTRAPPRCGCAPSNESETESRMDRAR